MMLAGKWLLAFGALAVCAATAQGSATNLIDTNWWNRFVEVVEATRERCLATQYRSWSDSGYSDNPPLVIWTETGEWTTNGAAPGFVRWDTGVTSTHTNTIFELGAGNPHLPAIWLNWFNGYYAPAYPSQNYKTYRVVPPYRAYQVVTQHVGRYIVNIETNDYVVTNVARANRSVWTTDLHWPIVHRDQIADVDDRLYDLLGWYGTEIGGGGSNFFRIFDKGSYGRTNIDGGDGIAYSTAASNFSDWAIGDSNTAWFTRQPSRVFTNVLLGAITYEITNTWTMGGTNYYQCGWSQPSYLFTNYLDYEWFEEGETNQKDVLLPTSANPYRKLIGDAMYWEKAESFHPSRVLSNEVSPSGSVPYLTFTTGSTNWSDLGGDMDVILHGACLNRTNSLPTNWLFFPVRDTGTIFNVPVALSHPWATIQDMICTDGAGTFASVPTQHLGDIIKVEWTVGLPKYGRLPWQIYPEDIDERWAVLTNLTTTAECSPGMTTAGATETNWAMRQGSGTNYADAKIDAETNMVLLVADGYPPTEPSDPQTWSYTYFQSRSYHADTWRIKSVVRATVYDDLQSRHLRFWAKGGRPEHPYPSGTNYQYDPFGTVYTQLGVWYDSGTSDWSEALIVTGAMVNAANFTNLPDWPASDSGLRGIQIGSPAATIHWRFNHCTN